MTVAVTAGHTINSSIKWLDQSGNPMLVTPTPDAAPVWASHPSSTGIDTLTVAPGGLTSSLATNAADANASDTLSLALTVGGVQFTASVGITISAAPQQLTSIQIATIVQ